MLAESRVIVFYHVSPLTSSFFPAFSFARTVFPYAEGCFLFPLFRPYRGASLRFFRRKKAPSLFFREDFAKEAFLVI